MKFSKTNKRQLAEFIDMMDERGCVSVSEWVSGSGRFSKPKVLPPFVSRIEKGETCSDALANRAARHYFTIHPRRKAVLVLHRNEAFEFFCDAALGREMR